jgi:hypothetical protein
MVSIVSIDQLRAAVGSEVALSDWLAVTQNIIDEFAEATRDAQWIHVDSERAARESPFRDSSGRRCTVAHGFLTLSLLTCLIESCLRITGASAGRRRRLRSRALRGAGARGQPAARPFRPGAAGRPARRRATHLARRR